MRVKLQERQGFKICCKHICVTDVRHSIMDFFFFQKWWIVYLLSISTPRYPRSEWQCFTHVLLLKGWQLQTGMCKSRTGNILPSANSLYSYFLSLSLSLSLVIFFIIFFYFTCRNGRGLNIVEGLWRNRVTTSRKHQFIIRYNVM